MSPKAAAPKTSVTEAKRRKGQEERLRTVWDNATGWRYFSNCNNQVVGLWYTGASFFFFLFAGVLALIMRTQLAVPNQKPTP